MHGGFQTSRERDWMTNLKHFCLSLSYYNCMIQVYFLIRQLMFHRHIKSWNVCHKKCDINSRHFYHESLDSSHNTQRTSSSVSSLGAGSLEVSLKGHMFPYSGLEASPQRNEIGIVTTESMVTIFQIVFKSYISASQRAEYDIKKY